MKRVVLPAGILIAGVISLPAAMYAQTTVQSGTSGTQTSGVIKDEKCAPEGTLKENELCKIIDVPCENGKTGTVYSQCKSGKCIATIACGKQLPETPYEIPGSAPTQPNTQPQPTPSVGRIENPIPSTSAPSRGSGGTVPGGAPADSDQLPPVRVDQSAPATPGDVSDVPDGNRFTIEIPSSGSTFPKSSPVGGVPSKIDSPDGVYSGGNPFINPNGSTFGGGSWTSSSGASADLFSGFVSGLLNFFSSLWGGGGSGSITSSQYSAPAGASPSRSPDPDQRAEEILRRFQQRPESQAAAQRAEEERQKLIDDLLKPGAPIPPQSADRTGLPAPGEKSLDELLKEDALRASNPNRIPLDVIQEEERRVNPGWQGPRSENGSGTQVAENGGGPKQDDASPPLPPHPDWWPRSVETGFASGIEKGLSPFDAQRQAEQGYVDGVMDGLAKGSIAPESPDVGTARRILQEEVARAERVREIADSTCAMCFFKQIDRLIPVTEGVRGVRNAQANLDRFKSVEATARLAAQAGGEPQPYQIVIFGDPNAQPFDATGMREVDFFDVPSILANKAFSAVKSWWMGPTAVTPPAGAAEPASRETSRFLSGLSTVAERVYIATNGIAQRVGLAPLAPAVTPTPPATLAPTAPTTPASPPTPPPQQPPSTSPSQPQPTPTPAPTPPPQTPPAPPPSSGQSSGGFLQSGLNILSGLWQGLLDFFTGSDSNNENQSAQTTPAPASDPSGSITAHPSLIDAGEQTKLSWSSVNTQGCAVINASFEVLVRGGSAGDLISPTLSVSSRFGLVCDIEGGRDKFVNETLVRVRGDDVDSPPLFPYSGPVSDAVAQGNVQGSVTTTETTNVSEQLGITPNDVRTCDPDQPIDPFIRCLCEAEPNPAGCTIPPGGL